MKWPLIAISDFCQTGSGTTPSRKKSEYFNGDIPWVKSGELRETNIIKTEEHVSQIALKETSLKIAPKGAILVAMYGATVGRVGRLSIDACTNQAICHVVPDGNKACPNYVYYAIRSKTKDLIRLGVGGAQPNISQQKIKSFKIPLPPLDEQKRIAAILDLADALRRLRQRAIDRLNTLGQSIFHEMFGDPITNSKGWPEVRFSEACEINPTRKFRENENIKVSFLPMASVSENADISNEEERDLNEVKKGFTYFEREDVLLAKITPCFENRKSVIVRDTKHQLGFGSTEFHVLRPNDHLMADTILQIVRNPTFMKLGERNMTGSAGQKRVPTSFLKEIKIPVLPISLQKEFSKRQSEIQNSLKSLTVSQKKADMFFSSLQQRAFRGDV